MSASRSAIMVTSAAGCSTRFACCAVSIQCTDSRSHNGRWRCGVGLTPARLQTSPPTKPRHEPLVASTASIACRSTPYTLPFPTGPNPRRRCGRGREFHLATILDRQHVPPGAGRTGDHAPSRDNPFGCHFLIGEEPIGLQLAAAPAAEPTQGDRFARHHAFEDRRPPLSRRRSPKVPSEWSIAAVPPISRYATNRIHAASGKQNPQLDTPTMLLVCMP